MDQRLLTDSDSARLQRHHMQCPVTATDTTSHRSHTFAAVHL